MSEQPSANERQSLRSSRVMMARMSAMMLLQYWPLGIWGVTVGTYIAENTGQQGEKIFSAGFVGYSTAAGAIGSLISPVLSGFSVIGILLPNVCSPCSHVAARLPPGSCSKAVAKSRFSFGSWFTSSALHRLRPSPTRLRYDICADADAEYPTVRIFSTIGWIGAGLFLGFVWPWFAGTSIEATRTPLDARRTGKSVDGIVFSDASAHPT